MFSAIKVSGFPEQGIYNFKVDNKTCNFFYVSKALFKDTRINFKMLCKSNQKIGDDSKVSLGLLIRESPCFEEYYLSDNSISNVLSYFYLCPNYLLNDSANQTVNYLKKEVIVDCENYIEQNILDTNLTFQNDVKKSAICTSYLDSCEPRPLPAILNFIQPQSNGFSPARRKKREAVFGPKNENDVIIPNDGVYLMIVYVNTNDPKKTYNVTVEIDMKGEHGYLSADDYPFLPFYGIMCFVYLFYAISWLIVSALQWKDLLRIQYWIAAVILLGMIEKAVFYLEYSSVNNTGVSVKGAILFAELVSCVKRSLSRILVLIVSLGYGIVKPRLGQLLGRVIFLGILYFVFGSLEATIRIYKPRNEPAGSLMTTIPLATLDSMIVWWIFTSLLQTTNTLKLRRNLVKHKLYRDFTLVLTLAVFASLAFIIWVMHGFRISACIVEWQYLWFEQAYWHILFSSVLLIIMILFRPTNNNQRYAFTPLLDGESDDDDEEELIYVPEGLGQNLKMRHTTNKTGESQEILFDRTTKTKKDDEFTTIVDSAFPLLIDSEDELINKELELSKMM